MQEEDYKIMYSELEVKSVQAGEFLLHGHIDYVVANSATLDITARKIALRKGTDRLSNVYMASFEAKKDESFGAGKNALLLCAYLLLKQVCMSLTIDRFWAGHCRNESAVGLE